jgi:hypothetical protein
MKKFYLIFALFVLVTLTVTSQPQLTWRFNNAEVINAGTKLQFDVEVLASVGTSFHRDLQIYFDYNTAAFGSNIVANGKITYSPLTLMNTHYVVVNAADNTSSKFAIITEANNEMTQSGSATYFNVVPATYEGLLRFTIDILPGGNTLNAGIAFDVALMNGGQYYQSTSNTDPLKYLDPCLYNNSLSTLKLSSVYGVITYANGSSTPLKLCVTTLSPGGDTYGPTLSDGKYYFTGMVDGVYTISTTCTNAWGGCDGLDVILVKRFIAALGTLTPLGVVAADVNLSGVPDGLDVIMMKRKIAGLTTPSWLAANYVYLPQSVTVSSGLGNNNYQSLCSGDVNGLYNPPVN